MNHVKLKEMHVMMPGQDVQLWLLSGLELLVSWLPANITAVCSDNRPAAGCVCVCGILNGRRVAAEPRGCVCVRDWQVLGELAARDAAIHES